MADAPDDDGILTFCDDPPSGQPAGRAGPALAPSAGPPWRLLVVDDDEEIHAITRFVLGDCLFDGRRVEIVSAYSGREAVERVRRQGDFAVVLLDVVMEDDRAGLEAARAIREEVGDRLLRIVLRTGQPGAAPERQVIDGYDINGYLAKTEVTADKLYSTILTALRAWRDMKRLKRHQQALRQVIAATADAFGETSLSGFISGALRQLGCLLGDDGHGGGAALLAVDPDDDMRVMAGAGAFADRIGLPVEQATSPTTGAWLAALVGSNDVVAIDDAAGGFAAALRNSVGGRCLLYARRPTPPDAQERDLLSLYCHNLTVAYENLHLRAEAEDTRRDIVFLLAEAVERRGANVSRHVRRVAEIVRILARGAGLPADVVDDAALAAALHDVGQMAMPDNVLGQSGPLSEADWRVVRGHCAAGHRILQASRRPILRLGAVAALTHHERWDGRGYPEGLAGEAIPLVGRMTALADCFDALLSRRPWRDPWPLDQALDYLRGARGAAFDPALVDVFFANIDGVLAVRARHADGSPRV